MLRKICPEWWSRMFFPISYERNVIKYYILLSLRCFICYYIILFYITLYVTSVSMRKWQRVRSRKKIKTHFDEWILTKTIIYLHIYFTSLDLILTHFRSTIAYRFFVYKRTKARDLTTLCSPNFFHTWLYLDLWYWNFGSGNLSLKGFSENPYSRKFALKRFAHIDLSS